MLEVMKGDTEGETRDYAIVLTFYCLGLRTFLPSRPASPRCAPSGAGSMACSIP